MAPITRRVLRAVRSFWVVCGWTALFLSPFAYVLLMAWAYTH